MKPRTYIEYVLEEIYKFNLQSSIFNKICNCLIDEYKYNKTKTIYIVTFTTCLQKKCSNKNDLREDIY